MPISISDMTTFAAALEEIESKNLEWEVGSGPIKGYVARVGHWSEWMEDSQSDKIGDALIGALQQYKDFEDKK